MSMNSLKSTALEQEGKIEGTATQKFMQRIGRILPVYGLLILTFILIALFSILLPNSFPTLFNLQSILSDKSIIALLSLAAVIPMIAGKIDLSVGYGIALWHILAISFQVWFGLPWWLAVIIVLVLGALVGFINGLLVELAQIDAFIATLGTGTVIYAISLWHTGGRQVVGKLPGAFLDINRLKIFNLPAPFYYLLIITIVLWIITEYLPIGRFLYAIGANPRAAQLNGIPTRKYVIIAFMASGALTAFAGVILASRLRIGQAGVGLEFLLPALVGAFLGSTTIRPGRVNIWGTIVGVAILAVGISGIQQFGAKFYVEPLFNGITLIVAIGIASYAGRRRTSNQKQVIKSDETEREAISSEGT